ncbi:MAG: Flp family type IVb pilin [Pseudomonadota bacterium]
MGQFLKNFSKNQSGATAIEYGLIAAGIAVAIATIVTTLGSSLEAKFSEINAAL